MNIEHYLDNNLITLCYSYLGFDDLYQALISGRINQTQLGSILRQQNIILVKIKSYHRYNDIISTKYISYKLLPQADLHKIKTFFGAYDLEMYFQNHTNNFQVLESNSLVYEIINDIKRIVNFFISYAKENYEFNTHLFLFKAIADCINEYDTSLQNKNNVMMGHITNYLSYKKEDLIDKKCDLMKGDEALFYHANTYAYGEKRIIQKKEYREFLVSYLSNLYKSEESEDHLRRLKIHRDKFGYTYFKINEDKNAIESFKQNISIN